MPGEECDSPPGPELLGAVTSHGPFRECYNSSPKASGAAEPHSPPAASTPLSTQGMRAALFIPGKRASAIAVKAAGKRRGNGRAGKHNGDTAKRR